MTQVLLVEDSRTQARHVQSLLEAAGYGVRVCHDGVEALAAATDRTPDVVLSDVLMPELDGFELCLALRRRPSTATVPIVLMTALTDPADVLRALAVGADGYVAKPSSDEVLLARLARFSKRRRPPTVVVNGRELPVDAPRETIIDILTCALEDAAARHDELATSRARLEQAKAQQDELMGVVAHELRTPLNVLALRAQIEQDGGAPPANAGRGLPALADLVSGNVRQMSVIIDDLLDVARIESGAIRVNPRPGDLASCVRDVASRFAMISAEHPIELDVPDHVEARFDPSRVEQILGNLLSNAIKYSPDGGRIVVRVRSGPEAVEVAVEDRGMGLPAGFEERLFGRYVRAPGSDRVAHGVGLGLYITRRLVEIHGGRIGVESLEPKGSRFWFTLPHGA